MRTYTVAIKWPNKGTVSVAASYAAPHMPTSVGPNLKMER